ncbi:hypothetical protein Sste5346_006393 [Sporothrix stenoceras]|uniref:Major facilitator superfamily (MFS) profile domain-containing protein n=1 Tax=Sporothrix stenoceras TaxID=5173 RepID=A0ABR3Z0M4_9PEZI
MADTRLKTQGDAATPETPELHEMHDNTPSAAREDGERPGVPAKDMDGATYLKIASAGFSFFVAGVNDGSIGALLPYILQTYGITTASVTAVYAANFAGWALAAVSNTHLSQHLSLGSMLFVGAGLQVLAQSLRAWLPPFGLYVVTFGLACLGQAYQDTHANTFVAGTRAAHRGLAFIHAMYMAGCLSGPFCATAIAASAPLRWPLFYCFPLGLGVVNMALVSVAFRDCLFRTVSASDTDERPAAGLLKETLALRSVWLLSLFFFFFLGATLTASGWMVAYLVDVRHGRVSEMGYVPAGFSGGALLGRLLLAEPTHRFGPHRMIFIYALLCIGLQLVFWLVPNIIAAAIAVSLLGFLTGPYFATGISIGSKLFPSHLRPTALSLVFVFAQIGGCIFPVITGLLSSTGAGDSVLQPMLCALLASTAISWLFVPRPKTSGTADLHQE